MLQGDASDSPAVSPGRGRVGEAAVQRPGSVPSLPDNQRQPNHRGKHGGSGRGHQGSLLVNTIL